MGALISAQFGVSFYLPTSSERVQTNEQYIYCLKEDYQVIKHHIFKFHTLSQLTMLRLQVVLCQGHFIY